MVKVGYKQTEIGVIPEDWEILSLNSIVVNDGLIRGPFGGSLKKEYFVNNGYKVYEQRNAIYKTTDIGNYFINAEKFLELKRFEINGDDFIVSCSGTIGKIFQIPRNAPKGVINQALLKIKLDNKKIDNYYFLSIFNSTKFQAQIIDNSHGGAMPNLVGMDTFRKILIPIPPKEEQKAIANALSDVDALITSLEKLIAKKESIKTATMQQLLIGKKRLNGFSGKWEEKKLGDIASFYKGKGLPKSQLSIDGKYKCIHYGELFTTYKEIVSNIQSFTNYCDNTIVSTKNDILMPTSDVTPNGLATASCTQEDGIILGGDILIIRPNNNILDGRFFAFYISIDKNQIMQLISGSTVYHLYGSDMAKFVLNVPPTIEEQQAIAQILTDMDNEIETLKTKLSKTKAMKDGMMSELLSGKTRLKV